MTDRKKVIAALSECNPFNQCYEERCPYYKDNNCLESLHEDVLKLLKKQEPIPCGEKIKAGDVVLDFYECGYCKNAIRKPWRYCPFCGKAVKWDETHAVE